MYHIFLSPFSRKTFRCFPGKLRFKSLLPGTVKFLYIVSAVAYQTKVAHLVHMMDEIGVDTPCNVR